MSAPRDPRYGRVTQGSSVVWLTPPSLIEALGPFDLEPWVERLAEHGDGLALIPARTETAWFQRHVWPCCDGVLMAGRPRFHHINGDMASATIPLPVCLAGYGNEAVRRLIVSQLPGCLVTRVTVIKQPHLKGGES